MIEGQFDEEGKLLFEINLVTIDGETIPVEVVLDTGFTEWIVMNTQDIDSVGWNKIDNKIMQTAQGETQMDIYAGTVQIDGEMFNVPILGGDAIPEILMGLQWLKTRRLVVDFPAGVLTLG